MQDEFSQVTASVRLCRAKYVLASLPEMICVDLLCQSVEIKGRAYAWVDGIDFAEPVLVPVDSLDGVELLGTLGKYLRDEMHLALGARFDQLLDLCLQRDLSATVLVRACEFMHSDGFDAEQAIEAASQWGSLMQEIDWGDRVLHACEVARRPAH